jgi:hypothetical protein
VPFQGRTLCVIIVCGNLICHEQNQNWKSEGSRQNQIVEVREQADLVA